jgi:hypothetical protein
MKLVIESLTENQWAKGCIVTMANFQELCGGAETADIIKVVLVLEGKAREIKVIGTDNIEVCGLGIFHSMVESVFSLTAVSLHFQHKDIDLFSLLIAGAEN